MTDRIPKVSPVDLLHARNDDTASSLRGVCLKFSDLAP